MIKPRVAENSIYLTADTYIVVHPEATFDLEVRKQPTDQAAYTMGKMNYKYHHDSFASFIFKIFPKINLLEIHDLQKALNRFIPQ